MSTSDMTWDSFVELMVNNVVQGHRKGQGQKMMTSPISLSDVWFSFFETRVYICKWIFGIQLHIGNVRKL